MVCTDDHAQLYDNIFPTQCLEYVSYNPILGMLFSSFEFERLEKDAVTSSWVIVPGSSIYRMIETVVKADIHLLERLHLEVDRYIHRG